jgi:hypothetical protein
LQIACRKGQVELASALLYRLNQHHEKTVAENFAYRPHIQEIQQAFNEFAPLLLQANANQEDHKIAAAAILRTLLEDYPDYYRHFEAGSQKFIKKLVFACGDKDPALFEAFRNALILAKRKRGELGHSSKLFGTASVAGSGRRETLPMSPASASQSISQLTRRSSTQ